MFFVIPLLLGVGGYLGWKANNGVSELTGSANLPATTAAATVAGMSMTDVILLGGLGLGGIFLYEHFKHKRG